MDHGEATGSRGPVHLVRTPLFLAHPRGPAQIAPILFPDTCRRCVHAGAEDWLFVGGRGIEWEDWASTPVSEAVQDSEWSRWEGQEGTSELRRALLTQSGPGTDARSPRILNSFLAFQVVTKMCLTR